MGQEVRDDVDRRSVDEAQAHIQQEKQAAIRQACDDQDLQQLVKLANSPGGLLDDELRKIAWPLFLNVTKEDVLAASNDDGWQALPPHRDEEQVQKDVDRAFVYYPNDESQKQLDAKRSQLFQLIARVLRSCKMLYYFQGYHDIAQVMLLVLGDIDAFPSLLRLSVFRIRDYMLHSISPAVKHLHLIPAILQRADPVLAQHLSHNRPIFALANALTLYAHDIQEYADIARLYDFLLAHDPVMSIYIFATIVIRRRDELLEISLDDQDMLQYTLQKLPQPLDLDGIITETLHLYQEHKPEVLPGRVWARISSASVLKASRNSQTPPDLKEAQRLFATQEKELRREETMMKAWKYGLRNRRSLLSVTAAILVGAASIWLRRSGNDRVLLASLSGMWRFI